MSQASNFTFRKKQTGNTVIQNAYLSSSGPNVFDREPQEASVSNSSSNPFRSGNVVQDAHPLPIHPSNSNDDSFPETVVKEEVEQSNVAQQFNSYSIFPEASPTTPMTRPFYRQVQAKDTVGNVAAESPFQQSDYKMDPMLHLFAPETAVKEECEQSSPVNQSLPAASSGYSVFDHSQLQIPNSPASIDPFRSGNVVLGSTFQQIDHEMDSSHLFAPEIVMKLESGQWIRFAGSRKMDPIRPTESMPEPVVKEEVDESSPIEQAPRPSFPPDAPLDHDDPYVFQDVKPKVVDSDMSCIGISAIDLMKDSDMEEETQEEMDDEEDHSDTGEHLDAKGKANTSKSLPTLSCGSSSFDYDPQHRSIFTSSDNPFRNKRILPETNFQPVFFDMGTIRPTESNPETVVKEEVEESSGVKQAPPLSFPPDAPLGQEEPYDIFQDVKPKIVDSDMSCIGISAIDLMKDPDMLKREDLDEDLDEGMQQETQEEKDGEDYSDAGEHLDPKDKACTSKGSSSKKKQHLCEVCQKVFYDTSGLRRHLSVHTGEKPYQCDVCQKHFRAKHQLTKHLRVHTGEKPFSCEVCQKCFSSCNNHKRHMLIHSGEKPFSCDVCKKTFRMKSTLQDHMRRHTGEKPRECKDCDEKFSYLKSLKIHRIRCHS